MIKRVSTNILPDQFRVDEIGFAYLDGIKLPFRLYERTGEIEFMDKDKRRAEERGYRYIRIDIQDFINLLDKWMNGC